MGKLTCQEELWIQSGKIRLEMSSKDTRLNLRVRSELKKKLELSCRIGRQECRADL